MLLRTILILPANKLELLPKAVTAQPDLILLDLEDGVSLKDKHNARKRIVDYFQANKFDSNIMLRINSINTGQGLEDILTLQRFSLYFRWIFLSKTETSVELDIYSNHLKNHCEKVVAAVETAKSVLNLHEIAKHPFVAGLVLGNADLCNDIGIISSWDNFEFYRNHIILHTKANKIFTWDSPYFQIRNMEGLNIEAEKSKQMGFNGKIAIHTSQVPILNKVFSFSEIEVQNAIKIISAFEDADENVCQFEGNMIDYPIYFQAKRLINEFNKKGS